MSTVWSLGTISIENGGTVATGTGTQFTNSGINSGDRLYVPSLMLVMPVTGFSNDTTLNLKYPWNNDPVVNADYEVWYTSNTERLSAGVNSLLNGLSGTLVNAPAAIDSVGEPGQWSFDASYIYVCVATNSWKRASIDVW